MRNCTKCLAPKPEVDFYLVQRNMPARHSVCIACSRKFNKEYHVKNSEQVKQRLKRYRLANKELVKQQNSKYKAKAWLHTKQHSKEYTAANRAIINERVRNKRLADPQKRLMDSMRAGVTKFFKKGRYKKEDTTLRLIGCSWNYLQGYLRQLYSNEMSDNNYGKYWSIDHDIPLSAWNLSDATHRIAANHYSNLRPMEAIANIKKGGTNRKPAGFYDTAIKHRLDWLKTVGVLSA